ncbi:MAG: xanthine dehydrogenase family protein subunit M [Chloroflexi bacterium]|nr:xanthine dehydrogenase family protein subunit M [Chloroflexota bacterium]
MRSFSYVAAKSVDEAVAALAAAGLQGRALAGGTDILVQMREGRRSVDTLVDVKGLVELNVLSAEPGKGLRLGAAVPCYRIYEDPMIRAHYPALIDCTALVGSVGIQGRATVGGNLCTSSPAADTIPALIALGGVCRIVGPRGERRIPVEEFCTGPGRNTLEPGELLVEVDIPEPRPRSGAFSLRFIPRNEMDIAVVNAAASVELGASERRFVGGRVAVGAVAPTPLYVAEAVELLSGAPVSEETFARVAEAAQRATSPITDMRGTREQRLHLVGVLVRRALSGAVERAKEGN